MAKNRRIASPRAGRRDQPPRLASLALWYVSAQELATNQCPSPSPGCCVRRCATGGPCSKRSSAGGPAARWKAISRACFAPSPADSGGRRARRAILTRASARNRRSAGVARFAYACVRLCSLSFPLPSLLLNPCPGACGLRPSGPFSLVGCRRPESRFAALYGCPAALWWPLRAPPSLLPCR